MYPSSLPDTNLYSLSSCSMSWFIFKVNLLYNYDTPLFAKEFPPEIFDIFLSNFSLSSFWSVS